MTAPTWQRELDNFIGIKPIFIIEGNVADIYPWEPEAAHSAAETQAVDAGRWSARSSAATETAQWAVSPSEDCLSTAPSPRSDGRRDEATERPEPAPQFLPLEALLPELFAAHGTRPYRFLFVDPLRGITDPTGAGDARAIASAAQHEADRLTAEAEALNPASDPAARQAPFAANRLVHDSLLVRAALSQRLDLPGAAPSSIACVFNLASRLSSSPEDLTPEENAVFMNLYLGAADAIRGDGSHVNTLVLVVNRASDVPSWLTRNNPDARVISIPNPDRPAREAYIARGFPDLSAPDLAKTRGKFIDTTDAMKLVELDELRRLYARGGTAPTAIAQLVDLYKYGIRENQWTAMTDKLRDDPAAALRRRVKGQDAAIEKIVTVLKRSVLGFSGMQHSSGTKPKGVLFLAGPTGTGKTEMVKAVTELLFGDERSYLRFDMSEYAAENADQKLFGAPPGYVGYEAGGQLTNAVRANPFSVLLFDEVEKAHPSIMDKFLQILEDGRMTDGQGQTVYFSETLIFFTSNVGISEELLDEHGRTIGRRNIVQPGEPYGAIQAKVEAAMATHFKPEVLNRIGDNIVVFDYISPEASRLILESQLGKINRNVQAHCGITVAAGAACTEHLLEAALADSVRENGGRGIGNLVENAYLNPLATFIFDAGIEAGDTVEATVADGRVRFRRATDDGAAPLVGAAAETGRLAAMPTNAATPPSPATCSDHPVTTPSVPVVNAGSTTGSDPVGASSRSPWAASETEPAPRADDAPGGR